MNKTTISRLYLASCASFAGAVYQAVTIRFLTYVFPFQMLFAISLISSLAVFFTGIGAFTSNKFRKNLNILVVLMTLSLIISEILINKSADIAILSGNPVYSAIIFTFFPLFLNGAITGICYHDAALSGKTELKYLITAIALAFFAGYLSSVYLFVSLGVWNVFLISVLIALSPVIFNYSRISTALFIVLSTFFIVFYNPGEKIFNRFALEPHLWEQTGNEKYITGFWSPYSRLDFYEMSDGRLAGLYNRAQQWAAGDPVNDIEVRQKIYKNISGDVLVVGSGGGYGLLSLTEASSITAVELDPGVVDAMKGPLSKYNRSIYNKIRKTHTGDGRAFLDSSEDLYDVIVFEAADLSYSTNPHSFISIENYLYTVEGVKSAIDHLKEDGIFLILVTKELIPAPKFINALPDDVHWRLFEGHIEVMKSIPLNFDFIIASRSSEKIGWWDSYLSDSELRLRPVDSSGINKKSSFGLEPITDNRPLLYYRDWTQAVPFIILFIVLSLFASFIIHRSASPAKSAFFTLLGIAFITTELFVINSMRAYLGGYLETSAFLLGIIIAGTAAGTFYYDALKDRYVAVFLIISLILMMIMTFSAPASLSVPLKMAWISAALLPASFFMGTLFPKALVRFEKEKTTFYYAADTIGASIGLVLFYLLLIAGGFYLAGAFAVIIYSAVAVMLLKIKFK